MLDPIGSVLTEKGEKKMAKAGAWVMVPTMDEAKGCLIDIYPLILCKDCKHKSGISCPLTDIIDGEFVDHVPNDDWFCADGEKRE